jgi:prepilin-type processing-associated H-X9-DG protein
MNWAGPSFQITARNGALPPPNYGVGAYYNLRASAKGSLPDWEARGYKDSVVRDPAGTILLAEQAEGGNIAGNDWPSFCMGPTGPSTGDQTPYQIALGGRRNWGANAYGLHSRRFNYLFHDGHAVIHKITDTVGSGTTNSPKGMWTMTPGD